MKLNTYDVRCAALSDYGGINSHDFDEWLESHDAEVRNEAIIARDTRTPAELIQAAWEAAYPVPKGSVIPAGTPSLSRPPHGETAYFPVGIDHDFTVREGDEVRTLDPLPPVIPDDCMAVWASVKYTPRRTLWVRDIGSTGSGNWASGDDVVIGEALIDPKPVPEEER